MSDFLGPVPIPEPPLIGKFPLKVDYGTGMDVQPSIAVHLFDQPGLKTEQRFLLGDGQRRFRVRKAKLSCSEYDNLLAHWKAAQGCYAEFPFDYPGPGGMETYTVRYENPNLSFNQLTAFLTSDPGISLLAKETAATPVTTAARVVRFPSAALNTALADQVQVMIPLIVIQPRAEPGPEPGLPPPSPPPPVYLSNRRIVVDGHTYLNRLLDWSGIRQDLGEASDSAQFTFGNADRVWTDFVNQVGLYRARVSFSLLHLGSRIQLDLWSGFLTEWGFTADGRFQIQGGDGVFELTLPYPTRKIGRMCWKVYKGRFCPSPSAQPECKKSKLDCQVREVPRSFGGMEFTPRGITVKDNETGIWGFGRSRFTSVSVVNDNAYQRVLQEIYTDGPMRINCDVAQGRDESEFYAAIGIVGEGPISGYSPQLLDHRLDGQPPHDPQNKGGFRGALGTDPAGVDDYLEISEWPWTVPIWGPSYAAGVAFAEIRRTDETGLQLSKTTEREMSVMVTGGIAGWIWTAPGVRVWQPALSNWAWVLINVYLRALGLRANLENGDLVPAAEMEKVFDVNQAIATAAIADLWVPKEIGNGNEKQFPFRGVLKEQKPLKDWMREIATCGLGYYTFVDGKLWIGSRINSSVRPPRMRSIGRRSPSDGLRPNNQARAASRS